jgi:hypothetical protein
MEIGGARRVSLDERQDLRSNTVLGENEGLSAGMVLEVGTPARRCNGRQGPPFLSGIMGGTVVAVSLGQDEGRLRGVRAGRQAQLPG